MRIKEPAGTPVAVLAGLVVGLVTLVGFQATADACSCLFRPLEAHIADAEGIFKGEVLDISSEGVVSEGGLVRGGGNLQVTFAVSEVWNGPFEERVTVSTPAMGAACGYGFEVGRRYVVFAYVGDGGWATGLCTATTPVEQAAELLELLGTGRLPGGEMSLETADLLGVWSSAPTAPEEAQNVYELHPDGRYGFRSAQTNCQLGTVEASGTWELKGERELQLTESQRRVRITARIVEEDGGGCHLEEVTERDMEHLRPVVQSVSLRPCDDPDAGGVEASCLGFGAQSYWRVDTL